MDESVILLLMEIYTGAGAHDFFGTSYKAKQLLNDSMTRTLNGYQAIERGYRLRGCTDVLIARLESAAAFSLVALSATILLATGSILTPCFLIPATILHLASRIPGTRSQQFTQKSGDCIYRTLKVAFIALPVIFLFLSASGINAFLPLQPQNGFSRTIHSIVAPLGPLRTIRAVVPDVIEIIGVEKRLSPLGAAEEYLRALSSENSIKDVTTSYLRDQYSNSQGKTKVSVYESS